MNTMAIKMYENDQPSKQEKVMEARAEDWLRLREAHPAIEKELVDVGYRKKEGTTEIQVIVRGDADSETLVCEIERAVNFLKDLQKKLLLTPEVKKLVMAGNSLMRQKV